MIQIKDKYQESTIKIPKNADYSGDFVFRVYSPVSQTINEYNVSDEETSNNFYVFQIEELVNLADGEYNWTLIQDEDTVATGILQVGDGEETVQIVQYGAEIEYKQYYPQKPVKGRITLSTEAHLSETVDKIEYKVVSNRKWVLNFYDRHHTQSDWSLAWSENHSERGLFNGSINIGPQVTDYPRHYKIVVETDDGLGTASQEITQDAHYYFTVDVYSPSDTISASATTLSYGIQYSEYQSVHTGKFLIYKDGELYLEQPFGWYPYGFSTYTQIPANSGETDVSWTVTGILDNGQTDSCTVVQEAYEEEPTDYSKKRFTIEMLEDGDISWEGRGYEYYDIIRNGVRDEGNQLGHSVDGLLAGDIVEFYLMTDNTNKIGTSITSTAKHNIYGNIMSLLYVDFEDVVRIPSAYQFAGLFKNDSGLVNAENLILPATALTENCYDSMFYGASLTTAPALPATTLADCCYMWMFFRCTSLTEAPALPATTLADWCYQRMFYRCTSLNYIKCLATDISAANCTTNWTDGVAQLGTFVKPFEMKDWTYGNNGIPSTWLVENA